MFVDILLSFDVFLQLKIEIIQTHKSIFLIGEFLKDKDKKILHDVGLF